MSCITTITLELEDKKYKKYIGFQKQIPKIVIRLSQAIVFISC